MLKQINQDIKKCEKKIKKKLLQEELIKKYLIDLIWRLIKQFLKIKCPLEKAPKILNAFFKKNRINIIVGKGFFPLSKNNNKNIKIEFSAANGREVEFYSSMIFSIEVKIKSKFKNFISGGRYDHLTTNLGFKKVSAVGAAVNMNLYD